VIADALREQGAPVPDDLLTPPVWPSAAPYRAAFTTLSASRPQGANGWEAIPYPWIVKYAERNGFADTLTELDEFVGFIQVQDRAFLEQSAALAKRKAGQK
jgi:hypothetical protein